MSSLNDQTFILVFCAPVTLISYDCQSSKDLVKKDLVRREASWSLGDSRSGLLRLGGFERDVSNGSLAGR